MPDSSWSVGGKLSLVGLRGAGKSSVGRLLAERLGVLYLDLDAELVREHGQLGESTGALLERVGLPRFRELESASLRQCLGRDEKMVLATGGGAILDAGNRKFLLQQTFCVWLKADPEQLIQRIAKDPQVRPALTELSPLEEMRQLAGQREAHYSSTAKLCVETGGRSIESIVGGLFDELSP